VRGPISAKAGLVLGLAVPMALTTLTACGASSQQPSVSGAQLARKVTAALTRKVGHAPDAVTCPDMVPARVGSRVRCTLTDDGASLGVTVTATSLTGCDGVQLHIKVDNQ